MSRIHSTLQRYKSKSHGSNKHFLVPFDLHGDIQTLLDTLQCDHDFHSSKPTLILFECVQMYLTDICSFDMLQKLAKTLNNSVVAIYDPMLLNDAFGRVMLKNLRSLRYIRVIDEENNEKNPVLFNVRTLQDQLNKLKKCGFSKNVMAYDMLEAYQHVLTAEHRMKANQCEMLDEFEEWSLLMKHYSFVIASVENGIFSTLNI